MKFKNIKLNSFIFAFLCMILIVIVFIFGIYIADRYKATILDYYNKIVIKAEEYYYIIKKALESSLSYELPIE